MTKITFAVVVASVGAVLVGAIGVAAALAPGSASAQTVAAGPGSGQNVQASGSSQSGTASAAGGQTSPSSVSPVQAEQIKVECAIGHIAAGNIAGYGVDWDPIRPPSPTAENTPAPSAAQTAQPGADVEDAQGPAVARMLADMSRKGEVSRLPATLTNDPTEAQFDSLRSIPYMGQIPATGGPNPVAAKIETMYLPVDTSVTVKSAIQPDGSVDMLLSLSYNYVASKSPTYPMPPSVTGIGLRTFRSLRCGETFAWLVNQSDVAGRGDTIIFVTPVSISK
jgi:hypothetical protein